MVIEEVIIPTVITVCAWIKPTTHGFHLGFRGAVMDVF